MVSTVAQPGLLPSLIPTTRPAANEPAPISLPALPERPFSFALNKPTREFQISQVAEPLVGLEVEYQNLHYTPPKDAKGVYKYLGKEVLACTKARDAAGNHLFKLVGEGQFLDENDRHDHACIEAVSAPLTHPQWADKNGISGAYAALRKMRNRMIEQQLSMPLTDFVDEYNKLLESRQIHSAFKLTVPDPEYGAMLMDIGKTRGGTSIQSNFTMPFEALEKNFDVLEDLTTRLEPSRKAALQVERQKRRAGDARQQAHEIVDQHFSGADIDAHVSQDRLRSFFFFVECVHL